MLIFLIDEKLFLRDLFLIYVFNMTLNHHVHLPRSALALPLDLRMTACVTQVIDTDGFLQTNTPHFLLSIKNLVFQVSVTQR